MCHMCVSQKKKKWHATTVHVFTLFNILFIQPNSIIACVLSLPCCLATSNDKCCLFPIFSIPHSTPTSFMTATPLQLLFISIYLFPCLISFSNLFCCFIEHFSYIEHLAWISIKIASVPCIKKLSGIPSLSGTHFILQIKDSFTISLQHSS